MTRIGPDECRSYLKSQRVGHLATVSARGQPHIVPVTFAVVVGSIVIGIDEKPKASTDLKRLRNIRGNQRVSLLWDHYDEDWIKLWWVRADGVASILTDGPEWTDAWAVLNAKYEQYEGREHSGPIISVDVKRWSGWSYS